MEAEAKLEAAKLQAEAQEVAANASAKAMKILNEAMKDNPNAPLFLLGDRYVTTLHDLSKSSNSKVVILPGDLVSSVKSILGQK